MRKAVFGLARDTSQARSIVEGLRQAGFSENAVSVLCPDRSGTRDFAHEQHTKAPEGATTGAATGGVLGGIAGWLVGIGSLAIPGLGPFVAAGPILSALSGVAAGATAGGVVGGLVGMGIPEFEAKRYEGKLREGRLLISVDTENDEMRDSAKRVFEAAGAEDVKVASEAKVDDDRDDDARRRDDRMGDLAHRS
jgi:hypothetical protein